MHPRLCPALIACLFACGADPDPTRWPIDPQSTGEATDDEIGESSSSDMGSPTTTGFGAATYATDSSASSSSDDTDQAPAVCGDGVVTGDEECDAGLGENADDRLCTSTCQHARCGDGHLQVANGEICDSGDANVAEPGYNGCSRTCTRGPHCGDGIVQPEAEECEPHQIDAEGTTCLDTCRYTARVMFVSSVATSGDLGGLAGADGLCNDLAAVGELPGTYRAWIRLADQTVFARFPELYALNTPVNIVDVGGELLATSLGGLFLDGPAHPIVRDETGEPHPEQPVWTIVTNPDLSHHDCDQWSGGEGAARVGHTGFMPDAGPLAQAWHEHHQWRDLGVELLCNNPSVHLYCLQATD